MPRVGAWRQFCHHSALSLLFVEDTASGRRSHVSQQDCRSDTTHESWTTVYHQPNTRSLQ